MPPPSTLLGRQVVLASASPRRHELLKQVVSEFEIVSADLDENALTVEDPRLTAELLARAKARAVHHLRPHCLVIGGDTVVAVPELDGSFTQLSKPTSVPDAVQMLQKLSGRTHLVITGVALVWIGDDRVFSDVTRVTFRELTLSEIGAYVATGEPMDKAGGYASQAGARTFITHLDGSLANVIGLPVERLREELRVLEDVAADVHAPG